MSGLQVCIIPICCLITEMCYACGNVETGEFVDPANCAIPASGANSTEDNENEAELIPCISGVCYVSCPYSLLNLIRL